MVTAFSWVMRPVKAALALVAATAVLSTVLFVVVQPEPASAQLVNIRLSQNGEERLRLSTGSSVPWKSRWRFKQVGDDCSDHGWNDFEQADFDRGYINLTHAPGCGTDNSNVPLQEETEYTARVSWRISIWREWTYRSWITKFTQANLNSAPRNIEFIVGDDDRHQYFTATWERGQEADGEPNSRFFDSYEYRYRPKSGGEWSTWENNSQRTSANVQELTRGVLYEFQVRARNKQGAGAIATADVVQVAPGRPTNLTGTSGDKKVTVGWEPPANTSVVSYYQYRYKLEGQSFPAGWTQISGGGDARSVVISDLQNVAGKVYTVELRATNVGGTGPAASIDIDAGNPSQPTAKPTLTATRLNRETVVGLRWTQLAASEGVSAHDYRFRWKKADNTWTEWTSPGELDTRVSTNTDGTRFEVAYVANRASDWTPGVGGADGGRSADHQPGSRA